MKKKGTAYYIINVLIVNISMLLLIYYTISDLEIINISPYQLIIYLLLFLMLNIVKYIRLYIIFLEEKIPIKRFTKLYIKTTFVNIIIPFKLGEIFRMYCFGKEISNYKKGIVGILLDRFVDTTILLLFLLPFEFTRNGALSMITTSLIAFVVVFIAFIIVVPNTYKYLNKFLIINKPTKISLYILRMLEQINELYQCGFQLLKGRIYLLAMMSIIAWLIDFYIIKIISLFKLNMFDISIFIEYLTSAVYTQDNIVLVNYFIVAAITFAIINFVIYGVENIKRLRKIV